MWGSRGLTCGSTGLDSGRDDLLSDQKAAALRWEEAVMQLLWDKLLQIRLDVLTIPKKEGRRMFFWIKTYREEALQ